MPPKQPPERGATFYSTEELKRLLAGGSIDAARRSEEIAAAYQAGASCAGLAEAFGLPDAAILAAIRETTRFKFALLTNGEIVTEAVRREIWPIYATKLERRPR